MPPMPNVLGLTVNRIAHGAYKIKPVLLKVVEP